MVTFTLKSFHVQIYAWSLRAASCLLVTFLYLRGPRWPLSALRSPRWKPWLVLCGNFKGPSITCPWMCLFIPTLHAGLGWGPEPKLCSACFNTGLALACDSYHMQKTEKVWSNEQEKWRNGKRWAVWIHLHLEKTAEKPFKWCGNLRVSFRQNYFSSKIKHKMGKKAKAKWEIFAFLRNTISFYMFLGL